MKGMIMRKILSLLFFVLLICDHTSAQEQTSGLLERSQIDEKYKWDLSDVYASDEGWESDFDWIRQNLSRYEQYAGKLSRSSTTLLQCLRFNDELDNKLNWVRIYVDLNRDVDMNSEKYQTMWSRYEALENDVNSARAFIDPEILSYRKPRSRIFYRKTRNCRPISISWTDYC
jgi:oligoendopeptidase F